ncbi:MAG: dTDP-4-amino-4,6-dideoxygalactose transaminase [Firmicutes bacterium]|nr:dTDP-4-amino-4,6-dideoxygalactose transaminase [Bacillota bacterium]
MINFNVTPYVGKELEYIKQAIDNRKLCGDGEFTKKCNSWIEENTGVTRALLTTSCTQALEMAAILADIKPGDEVILPSFTFVSTANAFVMRGAKLVFVDIREDTKNIDEKLIENAITEKTKVIAPVHYAGVGCEMDTILKIAKENNITVVEDAAQGVMASYKGKALGSMGDYGCFSFHETKNYSMGEGGAILINDKIKAEEAEIIREKGTDRSRFLRGQVDKYSWVSMGSSYLPSDMNAAFLLAQLEKAAEINENRLTSWNAYKQRLQPLEDKGVLRLPVIPEECKHNAHMFYLVTDGIEQRSQLIKHLRANEIEAVFHYVPLHSAKAGLEFGRFSGEDKNTTRIAESLVRLPMYYGLKEDEIDYICEKINAFYK